jgi:hypothetical protein
MGKIVGALFAEPSELVKESLNDSQYSLTFLLASRAAVAYVADAADGATGAAAVARNASFGAIYDAALCDSNLAHLAVGTCDTYASAQPYATQVAASGGANMPTAFLFGETVGMLERMVRPNPPLFPSSGIVLNAVIVLSTSWRAEPFRGCRR